jgi:hypothetical protein
MDKGGWFARVTLPDGTEVIAASYVSLHWAQQWLATNLEDETARAEGITYSIDYDHWGMRDGAGMSGL